MLRLLVSVSFGLSLLAAMVRTAQAGAFLLPEGQGQFIASIGYSESSRRFDGRGNPVAGDPFRKLYASGFLEYGLTPYISLIAAPTLARENGSFANSVTGSDASALGARLQLYGRPGIVVAIQALVQPPTGNSDSVSALAGGGAQTFATDFRFLFGQAFSLFAWPAFIDVQPGARVRTEPFPNEARLDLTLGVRPTAKLMLLAQSFSAFAPSRGPLIERSSYTKAQGTFVYDLTARWSVQAGGFYTLMGRNAIREAGPLVAAWYRF